MKIFLCDDKKVQLDTLKETLEKFAKKYDKVFEIELFQNGKEMLFSIDDKPDAVDLIFLDIHMPSIDGVTIAERLRELEYSGEIIFVTVSKEHFLPAFDVRAFNYIVKNETSESRLADILKKVFQKIEEKEKEYIFLNGRGQYRRVELKSIHYFEIQRRIVTVHYKDQTFEFFSSMEKLENQLGKKGFLRVHRSILISMQAISEAFYDHIVMRNGDIVPIGRTYKKQIQEYISKNLNHAITRGKEI